MISVKALEADLDYLGAKGLEDWIAKALRGTQPKSLLTDPIGEDSLSLLSHGYHRISGRYQRKITDVLNQVIRRESWRPDSAADGRIIEYVVDFAHLLANVDPANALGPLAWIFNQSYRETEYVGKKSLKAFQTTLTIVYRFLEETRLLDTSQLNEYVFSDLSRVLTDYISILYQHRETPSTIPWQNFISINSCHGLMYAIQNALAYRNLSDCPNLPTNWRNQWIEVMEIGFQTNVDTNQEKRTFKYNGIQGPYDFAAFVQHLELRYPNISSLNLTAEFAPQPGELDPDEHAVYSALLAT